MTRVVEAVATARPAAAVRGRWLLLAALGGLAAGATATLLIAYALVPALQHAAPEQAPALSLPCTSCTARHQRLRRPIGVPGKPQQ